MNKNQEIIQLEDGLSYIELCSEKKFLEIFRLIEDKLNYSFINKQLLLNSFTHPSFKNEYNQKLYKINSNKLKEIQDYQKLEFIGDSFLNLAVSTLLLEEKDFNNEGLLSRMRSYLVNQRSFSKFSRFLNLNDFIYLGKGEELSKVANQDKVCCDLFESLFGAIYLDSNFEKAFRIFKEFIKRYQQVNKICLLDTSILEKQNYKSQLQELLLKKYKMLPEYQSSMLDDRFEVSISLNNKVLIKDTFLSKKEGEKDLAKRLIQKFEQENKNIYY